MATDPVRQIERHRFSTSFEPNLIDTLKRLASLPPSLEAPYVTISLDWRPDGTNPNIRPAERFFEDQSDELLSQYHEHTPEFDAVSDAIERTEDALADEIGPEIHGIVIIAGGRDHVFEIVPLGSPVPNQIVAGPTPALSTLARMADEHQPYAFLVADQREATLTIVAQTRPTRELDVEATDYPRKQQQGGWSQRRYQARADERVAAFARTVAEEVRKTLDATGVSMLIVAASDVVLSELTDAFLQSVHERIIGSVGLDSSAAHLDIVGAATPLLERTERKRELAAVEAVRDGVAAGGRGVAGAEDVLTALQTGQVMTLVMNDAFSMNGWADYSMPIYGAGDVPRQHPAGGDAKQIVPIALKEEMVRLALQQDAAIEFVRTLSDISEERNAELPQEGSEQRTEAAAMLDAYGGVGAVLRFALDSGQSTADL